jgi:hypothetical protein
VGGRVIPGLLRLSRPAAHDVKQALRTCPALSAHVSLVARSKRLTSPRCRRRGRG